MPNPSEVTKKIDQLAEIAITEYKLDTRVIRQASERAKMINNWAEKYGFPDTDIFMSAGGVFVLSTYLYDGSIEITVLQNDYDVFVEHDGTKIYYKQHQTAPQVISAISHWGETWGNSWLLFESFRDLPMTGSSEGITQLHSWMGTGAEFRWLTPIAFRPKEVDHASSSIPITLSLETQ